MCKRNNGVTLLDKETVTRQSIFESEIDRRPESEQEVRPKVNIDQFLECLEKAKKHVEDESVKECFDKAQRSQKDS